MIYQEATYSDSYYDDIKWIINKLPNKRLVKVTSTRENTMNNIINKTKMNPKFQIFGKWNFAYFCRPLCSWDIIASAPSDCYHNSRLISSTYGWHRRKLSRRRPLIKEGRTISTEMLVVPMQQSHSSSVSRKIFNWFSQYCKCPE